MTTDLMPRRLNSLVASTTSFSSSGISIDAVGRQDALGHRDAVAPLDQRPLLPGNFEMQRKIIRPFVPADMQDVAEVPRGEHADFGAVMLDGDVGCDRGPVHDQRYIVGTNAGNLAKFAQAFEHALGLVVRRAGNLMDENAVIGLEYEVGIGPADIDAYARHESPIVLAPPCRTLVHNALAIPISTKDCQHGRPVQPLTASSSAATARSSRRIGYRELSRDKPMVVECRSRCDDRERKCRDDGRDDRQIRLLRLPVVALSIRPKAPNRSQIRRSAIAVAFRPAAATTASAPGRLPSAMTGAANTRTRATRPRQASRSAAAAH